MDNLTLVNNALKESGVTLQPLTSANFDAASGSAMYARFKSWVQQAWKDIQMDNTQWFFTTTPIVGTLYPRIRVKSAKTAIGQSIENKQYFSSAEDIINVTSAGPFLSGDLATGTGEMFLNVEDITESTSYLAGTYFEEDTLAVDKNHFELSIGPGYLPSELDSRVDDIARQDLTLIIDGSEVQVPYIQWDNWQHHYKQEYGTPACFTISPDGFLQFYPHLGKQATIAVFCNLAPQVLVGYNETPRGLATKYHDVIYWKAVMYYANYESLPAVWKYGNDNYKRYMTFMDRDLAQEPKFEESRY